MVMDTTDELGLLIAQRIRQLRLARQWSREELATRAEINVYTLKHFERCGQISLERLLKICQILDMVDDVIRAFKPRQRIDVNKWSLPQLNTRQRGRRREKDKPVEV
jgi:transcriptional regulator with XRE-family HTH domain